VKAVMYHYVRKRCENHPFFRFLNVKDFQKQLDYFDENFGFATKLEWEAFTNGKPTTQSSNKIILTFDDATQCHYEFVFPELERRGLWGIFYVPTMPYSLGKMLDVHRIHLLCGAIDGQELYSTSLSLIRDEMLQESKREDFNRLTYVNQTNYADVTRFKRLMNYLIDYEFRAPLIDEISSIFNYRFSSDDFYIRPSHLRRMQNAGHIIGSHSVTHPVMSRLSKAEQRKEIEDSFSFLEQIGCTENKTYCHPYGGFHSFDKSTIELLNSNNVAYSFNVEPRNIVTTDITRSPQTLPRYDCNRFFHGQAT